MKIHQTKIPGLLIIEPDVFIDNRGFFYETYSYSRYSEMGIDTQFSQDNCSYSTRGVIRGLHYQLEPHGQTKLVQALKGKVLDVAVDLRQNSPTFGQHLALEISDENHLQLLIPKGFAHGFSVLSKEAVFAYKCDQYYNRDSERGINYNDKTLNINWNIPGGEIIVSAKDKELPGFLEAERNFLID